MNDRMKLLAYRIFDPVKAELKPASRKPVPQARSQSRNANLMPKPRLNPKKKLKHRKLLLKRNLKPKPNLTAKSTPETKAKTASDLTPQIAARAYELYEHQGHRDGQAVQNWDKAEQEIRETQAKAEPKAETKPAAKAESQPEAKAELKPDSQFNEAGRQG